MYFADTSSGVWSVGLEQSENSIITYQTELDLGMYVFFGVSGCTGHMSVLNSIPPEGIFLHFREEMLRRK